MKGLIGHRQAERLINLFKYPTMGSIPNQRRWYQCYHDFRQSGYLPAVSAQLANLSYKYAETEKAEFINHMFFITEAS